jgi:8-oxo-dGTP pyrophosphatase MutT (NUDIX family)
LIGEDTRAIEGSHGQKAPLQSPLRIGGATKTESRIQFGALCFRRSKTKKAGFEILLVSSRDTGRWIIPKGWPMDRETPAAAAAMEAWEEAGVRGRAYETCVGHYSYHKWIDEELSLPVVVAVFPLEVLRIDDDFPEAGPTQAQVALAQERPRAGCPSRSCGTCCPASIRGLRS